MILKKLQRSRQKSIQDTPVDLSMGAVMASFIMPKVEAMVHEMVGELKEQIASEGRDILIKEAIKLQRLGLKGDKGDKGDTYILTNEDKQEIANSIEVPIVKKVIEKTEVIIKEQPVTIEKITQEIKEVIKDEPPQQIATKLNTLTEEVEQSVIKGLKKWMGDVEKAFTRKDNSGGQTIKPSGGMGNWVHEQFTTSSATTIVTIASNVAANSNAILVRYNGQLLDHGVQYTISGKVISFTFTLDDDSSVGVTYVRT